MTAVVRQRLSADDAHQPLISSPRELIGHLAQVATARSAPVASRVARFGTFDVRFTLHGSENGSAIFDALPLKRSQAASGNLTDTFAIDVIDGEACGVARPRLAWQASDFSLKRVVPGWSDTALTTYLLRSENGVAVADWGTGRACVWLPSIATIPAFERAAPFRWLIEGFAQRRGLTTMHAAAVGERGRGVLIVGEGGSGKSTLALTAMGAGMDYLADDYCLIDPKLPVTAYRLFNTAKLRGDGAAQPQWTTRLEHEIEPGIGGKRIFNLAHHAPAALADRLDICALLLPEFSDGAVELREASSKDAFRRAAPSTVAQSEGAEAATAAAIGRLARALPAYRLAIPREPLAAVERIRTLISTLCPPAQVS